MRDWLSLRATTTPDATAAIRAADGATRSYAGLRERAGTAAGRLAALGVGPEDHVGIRLAASVDYVALVYAVMRLGATLVPLDDRLTGPELADRIDRADVTLVVTDHEDGERVALAADGPRVVTVDGSGGGLRGRDWRAGVGAGSGSGDGDGGEERTGSGDVRRLGRIEAVEPGVADWGLDDRLCLLFTSGTTGRPKVVDVQVRSVLASAVASAFRLGVDPDDRWLLTLPPHHTGGLMPIYRTVLYGTTLVVRASFDPGGAADDIDRHSVTGVSLVPTMLERMLNRRGTLADSLRVVLVGGAPTPPSLIERCRHYSVPIHPTYGMTETASGIAVARPAAVFEKPRTVGRPLFGTDLTIVDGDGEPVARGEPGEIVVDGPTVTPGYYGNPEATAEATSEHGHHTGDVGLVDESGRLYVTNRLDDRIITGGETVDPGEVADALVDAGDRVDTESGAGIADAAVVGLPDEVWGERVAALIVPETPDDPPEPQALLAAARERLAGYKLPRTLGFAADLPRTVSGTVDREAVCERLVEAGFEPERPSAPDAGGFGPDPGVETIDPDTDPTDDE